MVTKTYLPSKLCDSSDSNDSSDSRDSSDSSDRSDKKNAPNKLLLFFFTKKNFFLVAFEHIDGAPWALPCAYVRSSILKL